MSSNFEKLKSKLLELFMLDQPDLDFGIFRIMNSKRQEITQFLDNDLLPQVKEAFAQYASVDKQHIEAELNEAIEQAKGLGVDPETTQKVKDLRAKLAESVDITALENEVYSDLFNFFRRYYKEGDFLSLRRYKEGVYAIPYEGEEVKLYWANHDQYYIKTSEYLKDYTFNLPNGKKVHFKLAEADVEKDNRKANNNIERRFVLCEEDFIAEENGELVIRFNYLPCEKKVKQKELNNQVIQTVFESEGVDQWISALSAKMPTEKNPNRTLLEKHLNDYTARYTFDYFIHKDLGGFLQRELDFYIKNEIMHLDDVEDESAPKVEQYLAKIKVIRKIARKIIAFLEQLENFQKKLWLKKKFVVETNYCVTLDRVPEELYEEIAANNAQREEWVRLFAINEIEGQQDNLIDSSSFAYSEPLSIEFLKANLYLILDTKFFSEDFKKKLLASFDNVDEQVDGLLISSENSQALSLLRDRYNNEIKCVYIDPPFNTTENSFVYKNNYRHSSWCTMVGSAIARSFPLLIDDGVLSIAIDDFELHYLGLTCDDVFGFGKRIGILVVETKPSGRTNDNFLATCHEYYLFYGKSPNETEINFWELSEEQKQQYNNEDETGAYKWRDFLRTGGFSTPEERPNSYYPIYFNEETEEISLEKREGWSEILPIDSEGKKRVWRKTRPSFLKHLKDDEINVIRTRDGKLKVRIIDRIKEGIRPKSVWIGKQYDASSHGTKLLKAMFGEFRAFSFPKSVFATQEVINIVVGHIVDSTILDYFAGSGTTGHAVINLNREDEGNRKYILVEMGQYFDTVLKPRIQKVVYSKDWKEGKPVSRDTGISHMFKYIRLESYEDCLNNLVLTQTEAQQGLLDSSDTFRESYMLGYMLDTEAKGSASLLNIDAFEAPFNYKLNIATGSVGETKPVTVDLVETFNYLLGLKVKHIDTIRGFKVVEGNSPSGEKVLVIWRNLKEKSNEDLEEFFTKQKYSTKDIEFDVIYVNGDNNLENLKKDEDTWKVRLIEEEFQRLMFDVWDI